VKYLCSRIETYTYNDQQVAKIVSCALLTGVAIGATVASVLLTYVSTAH
jgi:hypothetical protein